MSRILMSHHRDDSCEAKSLKQWLARPPRPTPDPRRANAATHDVAGGAGLHDCPRVQTRDRCKPAEPKSKRQ